MPSDYFSNLEGQLRAEPVPGLLYHYTSPDGILGIVRDKGLHASDVRFMNDSREFLYTRDIFDHTIKQRLKSSSGHASLFYTECLDALEIASDTAVYAASFSKHPDQLSQWRAYCPARGGYSIGFSSVRLRFLTDWELYQCLYDPVKQEQVVQSTLNDLCNSCVASLASGDEDDTVGQHGGRFYTALLRIAASFKDPSFEEETEWRLITTASLVDGPAEMKTGKAGLTPYRKVELQELERLGIDEALVGPAPYPELALSAARTLLDRVRLPHANVRTSRIPWRGW